MDTTQIDELTGLLDRYAGKEKMQELLKKSKREKKSFTVILYDINDLNRINDQYGHEEGDKILCNAASASAQSLAPDDLAFRLSGDEFIIVYYDELIDDAKERITMVQEELRRKKEELELPYEMAFTYGAVEIYPGDKYTVSDIIAKADSRMYFHKRNYHIQRTREYLDHTDYEEVKTPFRIDNERLYEALISGTDDYIFVGNMKTGVFRYPPAMVKEFGLPGQVVENAAAFWAELIHPHDSDYFLESNQEIADGRADYHCIEYRAKNVHGEWIWLKCRGRMMRDEEGMPDLFAGMITNLGKRDQIDHMTGLYNRFKFEGDIKKFIVNRQKDRMGIMLLDMDTFKNINDLYNRFFGDGVLRITAQKISAMLPPDSQIYRLDGDEFGIIVTGGKEGICEEIYGKIQAEFDRQQEYNGRKYYCTISAGYTEYPADAFNYQDLLKCATYALEHSKFLGKNRVTVYSPELVVNKERRLEMTELLRESIDRGFAGFSVHYQPQVDTLTQELYGAEALARWHCAKYGDISPAEFIPLLEQSGLIMKVGKWVLKQAVEQCRRWRQILPGFHMSINVSYLQLMEGDMLSSVEEILKESGLEASAVTLELTETHLVEEYENLREMIRELQDMGILIAMDDFGSGYSSMLSLKNIPENVVKIDREFVRGIQTDMVNKIFIRSITELCHNVGKTVCLEGVETNEEYEIIKDTGLELIQGYYFGRPVDAETFEEKFFRFSR